MVCWEISMQILKIVSSCAILLFGFLHFMFARMTELEEGSGTEDYDDEILTNFSIMKLEDVERYAELAWILWFCCMSSTKPFQEKKYSHRQTFSKVAINFIRVYSISLLLTFAISIFMGQILEATELFLVLSRCFEFNFNFVGLNHK